MLLHIIVLHTNAKEVIYLTELTCRALFDTEKSVAGKYIEGFEYPWQALDTLSEFVTGLIALHEKDKGYTLISQGVLVARSASIASDALILPPCFIDEHAEIRKGAFIRGGVIIGKGCVVGNSCEVKGSVLFDMAKAPHFNYVGDSILGFGAHLGAGAVTSNVKCDKSGICIKYKDEKISSGRNKLGALIGDLSEVGCNAVLAPGTVVGRNATVYPLSFARGYVEEGCILKHNGTVAKKL